MKQVKLVKVNKDTIMRVAPNGREVHTHMDLFRDQTIIFIEGGQTMHGHPGAPKPRTH